MRRHVAYGSVLISDVILYKTQRGATQEHKKHTIGNTQLEGWRRKRTQFHEV